MRKKTKQTTGEKAKRALTQKRPVIHMSYMVTVRKPHPVDNERERVERETHAHTHTQDMTHSFSLESHT